MTAFFLVWYGLYVLLGAFAHDFMATKVFGNVNVGLLIGLGQFLSTFVITGLYVRFANRELDPARRGHPRRLEGELQRPAIWPPRPSAIPPPTSASSLLRRHHAVRGDPGQQEERHRRRVLHRRPGFLRTAERHRDRRRLPSAASFLGIAGAIAVYGYDGFLYSIGFLVAWLVALLLVAELLRNTGKFTMADVLSFRLKQKPVRLAAATSTSWTWPRPAVPASA